MMLIVALGAMLKADWNVSSADLLIILLRNGKLVKTTMIDPKMVSGKASINASLSTPKYRLLFSFPAIGTKRLLNFSNMVSYPPSILPCSANHRLFSLNNSNNSETSSFIVSVDIKWSSACKSSKENSFFPPPASFWII